MIDIRVFYEKKGRIKYISHLDVNRCMQRSLKRSKLPVWYTQGFNPHLYLTFALPLSLGYESEYEIMDLRLTEDMPNELIQERLSNILPEGITIKKVSHGGKKVNQIASADYEIKLFSDNINNLEIKFNEFLSQTEIIVQKKTKKGMKDTEIKNELLFNEIINKKDYLLWKISLPAGTKNINPSLFIDEFQLQNPILITKIDFLRKSIHCEDGSLFE